MSHVLLIEPDAALARIYRQALEHAGYSVAMARGAQQAIHAAEDRRPDVVVLELQLASHSGVEFLHEFRSYADWLEIPVIINTHTMPQAITSAEEALRTGLGVSALLYKPRTSLRQLISAVSGQVTQV